MKRLTNNKQCKNLVYNKKEVIQTTVNKRKTNQTLTTNTNKTRERELKESREMLKKQKRENY